jgi:hypothetical protein
MFLEEGTNLMQLHHRQSFKIAYISDYANFLLFQKTQPTVVQSDPTHRRRSITLQWVAIRLWITAVKCTPIVFPRPQNSIDVFVEPAML